VGGDYKRALAPYERASTGRAVLDLATSVLPYLALWVAMVWAYDVSYLLVLALAVPAAGFLLRTYIMFHDCTHGAFLPGKRANTVVGTILGLFVFTPFAAWKHNHQVHHATAGDLDRRGVGDVTTLTVAEYQARDLRGRLAYRAFRNPLIMFGLGPLLAMVIGPRLVSRDARPRIKRSVMGTNLALLVLVALAILVVGWPAYLLIQLPVALMAGGAGIWLFFVQHQFEDAYWENHATWSYEEAALRGSSYLKLPKVLQFFSGNIGLHHVHHLSARIPNYHLQRAHDEVGLFQDVPVLTMWQGIKAVRLKLWCEDERRLVTWREVHRRPAPALAPT
jgi:omega-6 fatty acid desaturase (delta-12 desaturase)